MVKPCNLIICGPGEGQTDQYASAVTDALRMLLSAMTAASTCLHTDHQIGQVAEVEPGCVIPAGGTFEFLLARALLRLVHTHTDTSAVSQLLADALLTVPRQIYSYSQRHFLRTQDRILNMIQTHSPPFSLVSVEGSDCCGAPGASSKLFLQELGLESVTCKYQLLLAVAQCVSRLLQVDTVLQTHTVLRMQSHRLTSISSEAKEDEADD